MSTPGKPQSAARSRRAAAYDLIAPFYDSHWGRDFLDGALFMYAQWLAPRLPVTGARVLDICCGSGEFAAWLAKSHEVVGIDLSAGMLTLARDKVPEACFEQKDMRTFRLERRDFDAAVCFYNSFNQLMTGKGLHRAFAAAAMHIRPGGWLLFDFIEESGFVRTWEFEETAEAGSEECRLRYGYDAEKRVATCRADVGGRSTKIRQRPLEEEEVVGAVEEAGFRVEGMGEVGNVNPGRGRRVVLAERM